MSDQRTRPRAIPTEKQARNLWILGSGGIALAPSRGQWKPLLRRGWVDGIGEDDGSRFLPPLRITAAGLRALADAIEFDGLDPEPFKHHEKPQQLNEHPHVTALKAQVADLQRERDEAQRALHQAEIRIRRVGRALNGAEW